MKVFNTILAPWFVSVVTAQTCPSGGVSAAATANPPGIKPQNIPKGCAAFEILVARGTGEHDRNTTGEAPGKFGIVVGDPLVDNVVKAVPNARGYPVQYPASMTPSGASIGAADVNKRLNQMSKECPDMKFAIVGYSQGAGVMRSAYNSFSPTIKSKIVAAVMFGDPARRSNNGYFRDLKSMSVCNAGNTKTLPDPVCDPSLKALTSFCFDAHVHYYEEPFMGPAIEFIIKAFRGIPIVNTLVTGNEPYKADASLTVPVPVTAKSAKKFVA